MHDRETHRSNESIAYDIEAHINNLTIAYNIEWSVVACESQDMMFEFSVYILFVLGKKLL